MIMMQLEVAGLLPSGVQVAGNASTQNNG